MEYREFRAEGVETDDSGKLTGLVTPFDRETIIGDLKRGGWRETVKPGTFRKTLDEGDALMVWQHNLAQPMARKSAGNLDLAEGARGDQRGLTVDADPVDTSYTRDCLALVRAKVVRGMSFGFNVKKDAWFDDDGKESDRYHGTRRELREVELIEVSPVTRPAYGGTAISARDESSALLEARERAAEARDGDAPEVTITGNDYTDMAAQLIAAYNDLPDELKRAAEAIAEQRASSISAADRKALAAKGHALPDGSYPIPDKEHLHSAAVLAASGHGDVPAAKRLIRKMAKLFGVALSSLPGFGKENKEEDIEAEGRDDPDGKEYEAIDEALRQLKAGDAKGAEKTLAANQAQRAQEPDASTPDDEDDDALLARAALACQRSRELGLA